MELWLDMEQESFVYSQLPTSTSIRLVKRDGRDENGLLKINLIVVDLNTQRKVSPYVKRDEPSSADRPSFHCLSYTWGNPHAYGAGFEDSFHACDADYSDRNLTEIRCNGKILKVRKNLHDFLLQAPTGWIHSIRNRANVDTGRILLHERVDGIPAILHTYVGFGDNVNWQDSVGQTPLHHAARLGKLESVLILLKGGSSLDIKDKNGQTAEDLAAKHGHFDVSNALQEARDSGIEDLVRDIPPFTVESPDDYIWIDALCIDQTNMEERASQVEIMSLVYSSAEYVLVWLGTEDEDTEHALSALKKMVSCANQYADSDLVPYRNYCREDYERYSIPYISAEEWRGLAALFLRRWFRRIWVVQEAVFANAIIMYCGRNRIQWSDLQRVTAAFFRRTDALGHDPSTSYVPINESACGIAYHYEQVMFLREKARELLESPGTSVPTVFGFESLTPVGFPFIATDPRDKVYALLPLAALKYGRELPLRPNYRISAAECYARFTLMQIMEAQNLKILTCTHDASLKQIQGLPSWVPDYSLTAAMPLRPKFEPYTALGKLNGADAHFTASENWRQLSITGVLVGVVASVAASRTFGKGPKKFELDISWFDLLDTVQLSARYGDEQPLCEVLWRTLCANTDLEGDYPAPSNYSAMFKNLICAMVCAEPEFNVRQQETEQENTINFAGLLHTATLMGQDTYFGASEAGPDEAYMAQFRSKFPPIKRTIDSPHFDCVRSLLPRLESLRQSGNEACIPSTDEIAEYFASGSPRQLLPRGAVHVMPENAPFVNAHSRAYGGRRLFTTEAGYLGLGPASIEPGDQVFLVPGYGEMMVLRQARQGFLQRLSNPAVGRGLSRVTKREVWFELVGEVYVHQIMSSHAVKDAGERDLRDIVLV